MESAMAPMITAILATTHGLKPRLSSMMILEFYFFYHISFWYFMFRFL
jgi:hypothetical protein